MEMYLNKIIDDVAYLQAAAAEVARETRNFDSSALDGKLDIPFSKYIYEKNFYYTFSFGFI